MGQQLGQVVLLVNDYDEAIKYFVECLQFKLVEDTDLGSKRWVVIRPNGTAGASLLLAKAKHDQRNFVGNQTGGRVAFFLFTDDFERDYQLMLCRGVDFIGQPRSEAYGSVIVFKDLYGNKWDLIQRKQ